jgi:hypothetical protein
LVLPDHIAMLHLRIHWTQLVRPGHLISQQYAIKSRNVIETIPFRQRNTIKEQQLDCTSYKTILSARFNRRSEALLCSLLKCLQHLLLSDPLLCRVRYCPLLPHWQCSQQRFSHSLLSLLEGPWHPLLHSQLPPRRGLRQHLSRCLPPNLLGSH